VFVLDLGEQVVKVFGENFQYRPADRIKTKWKQKAKLKLIEKD